MLNFKPTSCLSGLSGRRVQLIQLLLLSSKAQSKNEKRERMQSVYGSDAMRSRATITVLVHFSTFEKLQMKPAHGSSATMTAKDFYVFQSSFPPPSHAEPQQNLHGRLRSPSQFSS